MATTRPPGRSRASTASRTARPPPPTKTRSGSGRPARAPGASPSTTVHRPCRRRWPAAARRRRVALDGEHPQAGAQPGALDGHAAAAGADVPQHAAGGQGQLAEDDGADLGLGDHALAVGELVSGRPQASTAAGAGLDGLGRRAGRRRRGVPGAGGQPGQVGTVDDRLVGLAEPAAHHDLGECRRAETTSAWPRASGGESGDVSTAALGAAAAPAGGVGEGPAVGGDDDGVVPAAARAGRRPARPTTGPGARLGAGAEAGRPGGPSPKKPGIAGGQDAHPLAGSTAGRGQVEHLVEGPAGRSARPAGRRPGQLELAGARR